MMASVALYPGQDIGRLIRQHDIGRIDQRPNDRHPLLFSS